MLGQKRRLEACHIAVGCNMGSTPEESDSGRSQCILDEESRYTLNRRLTQSSLPRILGGQKVKMRCQISAGSVDLSALEPEPWSPCESSLDCSNFNFFAGSSVFDLISGCSSECSGDLRFLDALPSRRPFDAGCEVVGTAASARALCMCGVGEFASSSSSD